jgi:Predicted thioesterase
MKYSIELRYADTDQVGIIYFARHLIYVDEAITKFFRDIDVELLTLEKSGIALVVAHAEINYEKPLRYGEICEVDVVLERVGNTSISLIFKSMVTENLSHTGRSYTFL